MKNKKGFTLVELLAVIVLLSIIMIIVVPNVLNALNSGKNTIDKINKRQLTDAADLVIVEVISCKYQDSTFQALGITKPTSQNANLCQTLRNAVIGKTIRTTVGNLKLAGYFQDEMNNCNNEGVVKITTNGNTYKTTITLENVTCNNNN